MRKFIDMMVSGFASLPLSNSEQFSNFLLGECFLPDVIIVLTPEERRVSELFC